MAQDILITPGSGEPQILFRGSGTYDTPIELNVLSSYQSASSSGSALLFEGTEGQLFAITDNLSSGVIFSVAGAAGLPFIEADASGDVRLIEYGRYVGVGTGTPAYQLDVFGTGRFSNGIMFGDGTTQTTAAGGGGGGSTTGTASGVAFFGDDNSLLSAYTNTGLIYDSGNRRLGIKINPTKPLQVGGNNCNFYVDGTTYNIMSIGSTAQLYTYYGNGSAYYVRSNGQTLLHGDAAVDLGIGGGPGTSQLQVTNDTTTDVGLTVKGAASQSANLQEWQSSAGATLAEVDNTGNISGNNLVAANDLSADGTLNLLTNYAIHRVGNGARIRGNSSVQYIEWNTGGQVDIRNTYYNNTHPSNLSQGRGTSFYASSTMTHQFMGNGGIRILDIGNEHYQMELAHYLCMLKMVSRL
jgi:hypothetical protein